MRHTLTSPNPQHGVARSHGDPDQLISRLCWLAFLVTENWKHSIEVVCSVFDPEDFYESISSQPMILKSRRRVATAAITRIRPALAESARRTERAWATEWNALLKPASGDSSPGQAVTKAALQRALLTIDIFPRCALLLIVFEDVPINEAALLLDENEAVVRGAVGLALFRLTENLARRHGWNGLCPGSRN
jgi:hypothetical protein